MAHITQITDSSKREELRRRMDDFTSFSWRGDNAFDKFGAFIVGGKDALKFYNGPSFSNKYTKPQFESANSILTGVEFQTQKIDFTVGVYWFTIQEYREFLHWLHPYEVNELVFHHAPTWRYMVKVAKLGDSTRHILGRDSKGEYRYYTEIKLSFEVQGTSCLYSTVPYQIDWTQLGIISKYEGAFYNFGNDNDFQVSDLNTPLDFSIRLLPKVQMKEGELYPEKGIFPGEQTLPNGISLASLGENYRIKLEAFLPFSTSETVSDQTPGNRVVLFDTILQHLTAGLAEVLDEDGDPISKQVINPLAIGLRYMSETGLLTIQFGQSEEKLLTLQTSAMNGQRLCQTLVANKFFLPGVLDYPELKEYFPYIRFYLTVSTNLEVTYNVNRLDIEIESYARTNII